MQPGEKALTLLITMAVPGASNMGDLASKGL